MLKKFATLPMAIFAVLVAALPAIAETQQPTAPPQGYYYWPGPWHMWSDGYGWPFWWMFPMMLLFFFVVCAVVFLFARRMGAGGMHHWGPGSHTWGDPTQSALQILNERFARGEIQKEEYGERKAVILSSR